MDRELFDAICSTLSVNESRPAGEQPPEGLTAPERDFYQHLRKLQKGRIEQEFLPRERSWQRWKVGIQSIELSARRYHATILTGLSAGTRQQEVAPGSAATQADAVFGT